MPNISTCQALYISISQAEAIGYEKDILISVLANKNSIFSMDLFELIFV